MLDRLPQTLTGINQAFAAIVSGEAETTLCRILLTVNSANGCPPFVSSGLRQRWKKSA